MIRLESHFDQHDWTPEFGVALQQALADHEQFDHEDLRPIGVSQDDANRLVQACLVTFRHDWLSADSKRLARALGASVEIGLSIGVHLERARWDAFERSRTE